MDGQGTGIVGIGHPHIDKRSLEMAKIVVERIDANPELINVAYENFERWRTDPGGKLRPCRQEWKELLDERPWSEVRAILLDESDEGQRLRSSHPFVGIVTEAERHRIIKAFPAPHADPGP